jgi:hypothetical protein
VILQITSQVARITDLSHHTWLKVLFSSSNLVCTIVSIIKHLCWALLLGDSAYIFCLISQSIESRLLPSIDKNHTLTLYLLWLDSSYFSSLITTILHFCSFFATRFLRDNVQHICSIVHLLCISEFLWHTTPVTRFQNSLVSWSNAPRHQICLTPTHHSSGCP